MTIAREVLLGPIDADKATNQVTRRIILAIHSGEFKPGEQLPVEAEFAAQLNVAQMTLRQALNTLREKGFIQTVRGRNGGSFVTTNFDEIARFYDSNIPTEFELLELMDYRRAIENEATALAAQRATDQDLKRIKDSIDACLANGDHLKDHFLTDNRIHIEIAEASKSPRLVRAVTDALYDSHSLYVRSGGVFEILEHHSKEHLAIFNAISSKNPDAAWEASNEHLNSLQKVLLDLIFQSAISTKNSSTN